MFVSLTTVTDCCTQVKDAKKDHYTPQIPLAFQLQRGGFSFRAEDFPEADAAHLRVLREHAGLVWSLIDRAVPALAAQEQAVAAISTAPKDDSRKAVMAQKAANTASHVREHRHFLAEARGKMSLALVCAAARPRNRDGSIAYDQLSLIGRHGAGTVYQKLRIRATDSWLFDAPEFAQIAAAVKEAEESERNTFLASPTRHKNGAAAAHAVQLTLAPTLARIEEKLDASAAATSSVATAAQTAADAAAAAAQNAAARDARELDAAMRGEKSPTQEQRGDIMARAATGSTSILAFGQRCPSPTLSISSSAAVDALGELLTSPQCVAAANPAPPVVTAIPPPKPTTSTAAVTAAIETTAIAATPVAAAPVAAPTVDTKKRKRRSDGPGLDHMAFGDFDGSVDALWREYWDMLRLRNRDQPEWRKGNKPSRDLYNDKAFFYRAIAGEKRQRGSIQAAIAAVQTRLDGHTTQRYGPSWARRLLPELQREQPVGEVRNDLDALLRAMDSE